ncbi:MAG TPA: porin family protein [Candidatus Angelobacter sp.]|jgi:opacity protein-like surface antigen|nr:porin family protein [Candidatus Angelobacter sp.]
MNKISTILMVAVCLLAASAFAQDFKSEVSVQGTANFTASTNDLFSSRPATTSGGFLAGYRYHLLPWFAVEGDYAYTRNTQNFLDPLNLGGLQTNVHTLTGEAVLTASGRHRVRPYGLLGVGAVMFRPTNSTANALLGVANNLGFGDSQTKPAMVYGGGVDISLTRFMALRGEYRGLLFNAPGLQVPGLNLIGLGTPGFTHMSQPSVGLVWRF